MVQIPGISVQKNTAGKVTHVIIDVEQQQELAQPVLEQLGLLEDDFDTAFADGQTLEESEAIVISAVKESYARRKEAKLEETLSLEESKQSTLHLINRLFDAKGKN